MHPFPHRYEADLAWDGDSRGTLTAGERPALPGGAPPEFDGRPDVWSPEHLLVSAANLCLMTTFFALAKKAALPVASYRSRAEGVLEKTKLGILFTKLVMRPELRVAAADVDRARKTLESAERHCIVSNALKCPVELAATVTASEAAGAA
jgi:organic hydroperoxide reductase OsmC/OhrA